MLKNNCGQSEDLIETGRNMTAKYLPMELPNPYITYRFLHVLWGSETEQSRRMGKTALKNAVGLGHVSFHRNLGYLVETNLLSENGSDGQKPLIAITKEGRDLHQILKQAFIRMKLDFEDEAFSVPNFRKTRRHPNS